MSSLRELVAAELAEPVDPKVSAMAAAIAEKHGQASRAVLFYGSCLREKQLDGLMLDFYLIVSDYRAAYAKRWMATANRLIPPNVFPFTHEGLAAKYAVLSEADFRRGCGPGARDTSVFARFAQPARLVWSAEPAAQVMAIDAVSDAAPTLLTLTRPAMTDEEARDPIALWKQAYAFTYGAEIRAERSSRAGSVVDSDPPRYRRFASALGYPTDLNLTDAQRAVSQAAWKRFQRSTRRTQVFRLAKASATYAGGAEYIAWKINRHAGTNFQLKPWQKRHPLLAAISLLPRLLKSGAIR